MENFELVLEALISLASSSGVVNEDIKSVLLKKAESLVVATEEVVNATEEVVNESEEVVDITAQVQKVVIDTADKIQTTTGDKSWVKSLKKDLIRDEGVRNSSYRCTAGKLTIGVGRNLEGKGLSGSEKELIFGDRNISNKEVVRRFKDGTLKITDEQIDTLLGNDIKDFTKKVKKSFDYFGGLTDNQKSALVNMAFNMGLGTLKKFKKMHKALRKGNGVEAKKQALDSRWARQVKSRAQRVTDLFLS